MNRLQSRLAIALLFGGLFILTFLAATLVSGPIDFLYRSAPGLTTVRTVAQWAAILAAIVLFLAACAVAIATQAAQTDNPGTPAAAGTQAAQSTASAAGQPGGGPGGPGGPGGGPGGSPTSFVGTF